MLSKYINMPKYLSATPCIISEIILEFYNLFNKKLVSIYLYAHIVTPPSPYSVSSVNLKCNDIL